MNKQADGGTEVHSADFRDDEKTYPRYAFLVDAPDLSPLRRGPKGDLVASRMAHRNRILWAVVQEVADQGYNNLSAGGISCRAKVSRRTFYEHFETKDAALLEALDAGLGMIRETVTAILRNEHSWLDRLTASIGAYVSSSTSRPELTRAIVVEVRRMGAAGDAVIDRHHHWFAALLQQEVLSARQSDPILSARLRDLDDESALAVTVAVDSLLRSWLDHRDQAGTISRCVSLLVGCVHDLRPTSTPIDGGARERPGASQLRTS